MHNPGEIRRGIAKVCFHVIARSGSDEAIQLISTHSWIASLTLAMTV
jgi:hypothetical protein